MPSSLMVDGYDHNFITLSWLPPETPNGIVDLYRVTYQGFKDDGLIDEVYAGIYEYANVLSYGSLEFYVLHDHLVSAFTLFLVVSACILFAFFCCQGPLPTKC